MIHETYSIALWDCDMEEFSEGLAEAILGQAVGLSWRGIGKAIRAALAGCWDRHTILVCRESDGTPYFDPDEIEFDDIDREYYFDTIGG